MGYCSHFNRTRSSPIPAMIWHWNCITNITLVRCPPHRDHHEQCPNRMNDLVPKWNQANKLCVAKEQRLVVGFAAFTKAPNIKCDFSVPDRARIYDRRSEINQFKLTTLLKWSQLSRASCWGYIERGFAVASSDLLWEMQ